MPGRKFSAVNGYRYGFNGKENDNEVKGEGNQQDYGMRVYDPRLGRFLSVDPLKKQYPELTPYQFASNTPIQAIDLDGLEGKQYTLYLLKDGKSTPVAQVVEVDVLIMVSNNASDGLSYKKGDGDANRLHDYLTEGFKNKSTKNGYKFQTEDGLPVIFKFNMVEQEFTGGTDSRSTIGKVNIAHAEFLKTNSITENGIDYKKSVMVARVYEDVGNASATGAHYGGESILTRNGMTPNGNQVLDKNIIHEIIHAFYSYNPALEMGADPQKHGDEKIGGGGALSYSTMEQEPASKTNVKFIIKTLPNVGKKEVDQKEYEKNYQSLIPQKKK